MTVADPRFLQLDPPPTELDAAIVGARAAIARATDHLTSIPASALEREWGWIGGGGESDVRSGFYIAMQRLEEGRGNVLAAFADAPPASAGAPARGPLAAATEARWDLHGVLASLDDAVLDTDPGGEEWTVRETLGHIVETQRAYPWFTAWWLARRDAPDYPPRVDESHGRDLPSEEAEGSGSLAAIRARLDALTDLGTELWRGASEADLAVRARWSGFPVEARFRLGRWAPHIEEHTVQVEKTLEMIGRPLSEVDRLVRLVLRAYGRLESSVWGLPLGAVRGPAATAITSSVAEAEEIAGEIAEVARA
jgi:hypothetical protein